MTDPILPPSGSAPDQQPTAAQAAAATGGPTVDVLGPSPRRRRRAPWLVGGGVALALVAGGVAWGVSWYTAEGAQAAEAVPADALAYVGLTVDPSGRQKLDALGTFQKFPQLKKALGLDGDLGSTDVAGALAALVVRDAGCPEVGEDSVKGWIGDRAGLAALPGDGDAVRPLLTLEVTDDAAAERDLKALAACSGDDQVGVAVKGDWAAVSDSAEHAQQALDAAASSSLADSADFDRWTSAAGDRGVVTGYLAPGSLGRLIKGATSAAGGLGTIAGVPDSALAEADLSPAAGLQIGFRDSAVQIDLVSEVRQAAGGGQVTLDGRPELLTRLPDETTIALGSPGASGGLPQEQRDRIVDGLATGLGSFLGGTSLRPALSSLIDIVTGGFSLSVGPQFFATKGERLPVALEVPGDGSNLTTLLRSVSDIVGQDLSRYVQITADDGRAVAGGDQEWSERVLAGGDLGGQPGFRAVTGGDPTGIVGYADLDPIIDSVDQQADLGPLDGFGLEVRSDGRTAHVHASLTTD
ncbi:DUF3352 domain-containing protein [Nocardioides sp. TRM66260-LWL]|uniref:DUF3352 domain-containing protein n=1 Tax=Nocardioides sp. TRM66260-LWL TaxID=2874478 RepID=UPI001CC3A6E7|nr:DUF3352 domain-containing protein [Nocardioides sp. TRM66260-LWL]MBZ5733363.1 DUF3352 domain-containing protein [Nocardioides sp. TRM66260-LWL]